MVRWKTVFARAHVFQRHVLQVFRLTSHRICERGASPSFHQFHRSRKAPLPPVVTAGEAILSGDSQSGVESFDLP